MENQASQPTRTQLLEQAKAVQASAGVYLMKDASGTILYVGKAKVLPQRLSSYFQGSQHDIPRIELLVRQIHHFDVILTETEVEALILEATLIKKHKPRYNVRLKDDKAYPYLKIQLNDRCPRIEWTRRVLRDGARYFGPFPSAWAAREVLQLLNETFLLRDCSDNTFRHRSRPCILHQIGRCSGPCVQAVTHVTEAQYREQVNDALAVLEGKTDRLVEELKKAMEEAAEKEEFERAAELRDQIRNLQIVTETQAVDEAGVQRDRDVVGMARKDADAHATLLRVRGGKLISVQHYHLQNMASELTDAELLFNFMTQHYIGLGPREGEAPAKEVLLPSAPDDVELLEQTLQLGVRVEETPVDRQLLNVAQANASYALEQASSRVAGHGIRALEQIQDKLHLARLPARIECYDISNIQGQDAVASRVVFLQGSPEKNLYRRYKIRTVEGANDFAMMKEVLDRRFSGSDAREELPDLVVVDGGKGQLAQALAVLDELNVQGVNVVGLAKARVARDFQAIEVESSFERIFIPNRKNPVPLYPHTEAYKLLTHIRDEAHRFAISYHRQVRSKRMLGGG